MTKAPAMVRADLAASLATRCRRSAKPAVCRGVVAACLTALAAGCQVFDKPPESALDQLLRPVATSPDSVTLEIFHARIPLDKNKDAEALWQQVDEQCFDAELRRRLVANGLRAGVVGATLPKELAELLALESEMPQASMEQVITAQSAVPKVTRRLVQLNRRSPTPIQASEVRDEADVLLGGEGQLGGGTYRQVQGVYSLRAEAIEGQRVAVRILPELHHGELRNRYMGGDQGSFLMMPAREREVFEPLAMETKLSPGEMLVLGSLPEADASLGGIFHTVGVNGQRERKLILVRLLEVPPSEILAEK